MLNVGQKLKTRKKYLERHLEPRSTELTPTNRAVRQTDLPSSNRQLYKRIAHTKQEEPSSIPLPLPLQYVPVQDIYMSSFEWLQVPTVLGHHPYPAQNYITNPGELKHIDQSRHLQRDISKIRCQLQG